MYIFTPLILTSLLLSTAYAADVKVEAETGTLTSGLTIKTGGTGSYVGDFLTAGETVTLTANVATAGDYTLVVGVVPAYGGKAANVTVNGTAGTISFQSATTSTSTLDVEVGIFNFNAGANTITITTNWTYFGMDYILIKAPDVLPAPTKPAATLSDPKAITEAKALYTWMIQQYGSYTISGQQDVASANVVKTKSGVMPAILGGDYIDYSRNRQNRDETAVDKYLDSAKQGYLISLMWHWNAPTDINTAADPTSGNPAWWGGFYTRNTTFDVATAVSNTSSAEYIAMIGDIDVVATSLKKFQDAKIPVLWRPFHEAAGGWFWWGSSTGANYKKLWNILYDRLVNYHGIHNLIWVWTSNATDADWYPGDNQVDIIGMDVYTTSTDLCVAQWKAINKVYDGKKLLALSEFGGVPNIPKMQALGVWWSYFLPWTGTDYGPEGATTELVTSVFTDTKVLSRNEITTASIYATPVSVLSPSLRIATTGFGAASLFNLKGEKVAELTQADLINSALQAGKINISGIVRGTYWLQRKGLSSGRAIRVNP